MVPWVNLERDYETPRSRAPALERAALEASASPVNLGGRSLLAVRSEAGASERVMQCLAPLLCHVHQGSTHLSSKAFGCDDVITDDRQMSEFATASDF